MPTSVSQQTLARPASLAGVSLHTGESVTLTLRPAAPDSGLKFKRIDLPDEPLIDAKIEHVKTVERATTIGDGGVKVHTVEHVLSALVGLGVDNAVIEMNANEPPIGDGSARPYVELIRQCGLAPQDVARSVFEVREPLHVETKGGSILTVVPDEGFRISCTQVGPGGRFTQYRSLEITPETYEKEIAPARTFTFYEDIEPLLEKGLIKGGSLENAVVVRGESVLSKEPMRFPTSSCATRCSTSWATSRCSDGASRATSSPSNPGTRPTPNSPARSPRNTPRPPRSSPAPGSSAARARSTSTRSCASCRTATRS